MACPTLSLVDISIYVGSPINLGPLTIFQRAFAGSKEALYTFENDGNSNVPTYAGRKMAKNGRIKGLDENLHTKG